MINENELIPGVEVIPEEDLDSYPVNDPVPPPVVQQLAELESQKRRDDEEGLEDRLRNLPERA